MRGVCASVCVCVCARECAREGERVSREKLGCANGASTARGREAQGGTGREGQGGRERGVRAACIVQTPLRRGRALNLAEPRGAAGIDPRKGANGLAAVTNLARHSILWRVPILADHLVGRGIRAVLVEAGLLDSALITRRTVDRDGGESHRAGGAVPILVWFACSRRHNQLAVDVELRVVVAIHPRRAD